MAVVHRVNTLPEFGVPIIRTSSCRIAPELASPVLEDKIYIAVGKDVKEGKAKIVWTVQQSGGNAKICIIHVLVPSQTIPMGLGAGMPASSANDIMLREHRENERTEMHKILDTYLGVCRQMGVQAEAEHIESDSVQKGIVELIRLHGIKKLIMGAAADRRYFKKMTEIKSRKAIFVREKADISCQIQFICSGNLICTRGGQTVQANAEVPDDAPSPRTPIHGAGRSTVLKSPSAALSRSSSAKFSYVIGDMLRRACSLKADPRAAMPMASLSPDRSPPRQPKAASIPERQDTMQDYADPRAAMPMASPSPDRSPPRQPKAASIPERQDTIQELVKSLSYRLQSLQSVYHTSHSTLSNTLDTEDTDENDTREVLEEGLTTCAGVEVDTIEGGRKDPKKKLAQELEKVKDQLQEVAEELCSAQEGKLQLESRSAETDENRKEWALKIIAANEMLGIFRRELEPLQIELDNALQATEEVSTRKGDSIGTEFFSKLSSTEIEEATQNFDPSLKIGEGGCGSVYRGLFRRTLVAIKILKFHSMEGSQEFQQEVDVLSKVRHPHLVKLIGACPKPWTLVYEYLPNGSLDDWLSSSDRAEQLSWQTRIRIATELCSVLAFLHACKPHSIVHGDVKPGNILLDEHLGIKLTDFGLCQLLSRGERSSNNTTVLFATDLKGTPGYMDPEILMTQELTTKFDVYSFGIILLQLLTRKPAFGIVREVHLAISAGTLEAILDPLAGEWPYMLAEDLTYLALRCCEISRSSRPDLGSNVLTVLQSLRAFYGLT